MSSLLSSRTHRRGATALVTGAMALGLALVPSVVSASPGPFIPKPGSGVEQTGAAMGQPGSTKPAEDVPVEGGVSKLTVPADLLASLKAKGVVLASVDTEGTINPHVYTGAGLSLGVKGGVVANVNGKVGGKIQHTASGIALVNINTKKVVKVTGFETDLTEGSVNVALDGGVKIQLGTFVRPAIKTAVDLKTDTLRLQGGIKLSADAAAKLNATLQTDAFVSGTVLLDAQADVSLNASVDLNVALNLGLDLDVDLGLDLGAILGLNLGSQVRIEH